MRAAKFQKADNLKFLIKMGADYRQPVRSADGGNTLTHANCVAGRVTEASKLLARARTQRRFQDQV